MWSCFETICVKSYRNQKYLTLPLWMTKLSITFFSPQMDLLMHIAHKTYKIVDCKTSIFSSPVLLLCVHTRYNPFAHPSCSYYYLLSPSIQFFFLLILLFCTFYSIAHFTLILFFYHIYALVCYFYIIFIFILLHCPLSRPDFTYISLLIIPWIIYYVTNKEPINLETGKLCKNQQSSGQCHHIFKSHFVWGRTSCKRVSQTLCNGLPVTCHWETLYLELSCMYLGCCDVGRTVISSHCSSIVRWTFAWENYKSTGTIRVLNTTSSSKRKTQ